ncbi:MAG: PIN domain-containing protein [Thermoplasmata archaeon]|nr:PIN domain-containing protein [Thermoplasmata archaeon]
MRAVDTPVLLDLLRQRPAARKLMRELGSEEVGITELNLFELHLLAESQGRAGLEKRRSALGRLRGRVTVLPIDEPTVENASRGGTAELKLSWTSRLILASLETHGCSEWHTTRDVAPPSKLGRVRVVEYREDRTKRR